jgi:tRNA(fMet)-specific endonuclease VapC
MDDAGFLLDSNIAIYALQGRSERLRAYFVDQPVESLHISSVSLAEIAIGYGQNLREVPEAIAFMEIVKPVVFDEDAAMIYGRLPFKRARFDRLIAAHALSLNLTLVTNNEADFADIPDLRIENWTL